MANGVIKTLDDALKAVAQVGPVAREHAQKAEDVRHLPVEVVDAMEASGLWSAFVPTAHGGAGLVGLMEQFEILRSLAYEDTSAGWGLFICGGGAGLMAARLPQDGAAEVFTNGPVPMAGVFSPGGSATSVDGGVSVTGRWPFASGVGYAGWVMANAIRMDENGAPRPGIGGLPEILSVIVRPDEITLVDDWHVAGLRGTGSMSFTMDGTVVPDRRTFPFFGPPVVSDAKYRLPLFSFIAPLFAGMAVGLATRGLDEIAALMPTRIGPPTFQPASMDPVAQSVVGSAEAAIRGARESCNAIFSRYDARLARGEDLAHLPVGERAEIRSQVVWAITTCRDAVNELFRLGGASSIYEPGILQRVWRDVNVLTQHLFVRTSQFENSGKLAMGIDVDSPFI